MSPPFILKIMAKQYGFNGRMAGRLGGTVFVNTSDGNIAQQYNPKKPKVDTLAQMRTTTRFRIAHALAGVLGVESVVGLRATAKRKRVMLESMCMQAISVSIDGLQSTVEFTPSEITLSDGVAAPRYDAVHDALMAVSYNLGYPYLGVQAVFRNVRSGAGNNWYVALLNRGLNVEPIVFKWSNVWRLDYEDIGQGHGWRLPDDFDPSEWMAAFWVVPFSQSGEGDIIRREYSKSVLLSTTIVV